MCLLPCYTDMDYSNAVLNWVDAVGEMLMLEKLEKDGVDNE